MAEGPIHKKLKAIGMKFVKEKCTDISAREVKYKNMRSVADVVGINLKRKEVRVIEVKASKADYVRDKKLLELDYSYYKHCNYFYIMCPVDIIQLDDVPKEYGLLWVDFDNDNEIIVKRNPKKYTGRLKTMFDTSLKNAVKANTNDLLFHYVYKEYNIVVENKFKKGKLVKPKTQKKTYVKKTTKKIT
jgi:hypothetical protein